MEKLSIYEKPVRMKTMLRFTLPSIILMVFTSLYTVADGIVVSNYVGSLGLSAINIVYPLINLVMAVGFMLATGSNAVIAKKLGEGKKEEAHSFMTLVTIVTIAAISILVSVCMIWDEELYYMLGSDDELLPYCIAYGNILVPGSIFMAVQMLFQTYLVTSDRPKLAMSLTIAGGILNIILDLVLVGPLEMGVAGAAIASVAGQFIGATVPFAIFIRKDQILHFRKPVWKGKEILFSLGNGSSEMVGNLASAVITALYNIQMMQLIGEKGVAAISAILYLIFVFVATSVGFTSGMEPVISYHYGAKNKGNLHKLFRIGVKGIITSSVVMFVASFSLAELLSMIFASQDPELKELMVVGFRIMSFQFLFSGVCIFASGLFTALNNGKISALIAFFRTFVFEFSALLLLPMMLGINGVWLALPIAEALSATLSIGLILKYRKVYGY